MDFASENCIVSTVYHYILFQWHPEKRLNARQECLSLVMFVLDLSCLRPNTILGHVGEMEVNSNCMYTPKNRVWPSLCLLCDSLITEKRLTG